MRSGKILKTHPEDVCENHLDRSAIVTIATDCDSFGCERMSLCDECYGIYLEKPFAPEPTPRSLGQDE